MKRLRSKREGGDVAGRKSISQSLRFEIFKRDGFRCLYCGATPLEKALRVDHRTPVAEGGTNETHNLVTACFDCNAGKGAVPLERKKHGAQPLTEEQLEHATQIKAWLDLQREVADAKGEVIDQLVGAWTERIGEEPPSLRGRLHRLIPEFGYARLVEAFDIVAGVSDRVYRDADRLKYFYGVLRKWREGPRPEPVPPAAPARRELSAHGTRSRRAVDAAINRINAAPEKFPDARSRISEVWVSFCRAAWGSVEDMSFDKYFADWGDRSPVEVRGIALELERTPDGLLRFAVSEPPDFDPYRYVWDELQIAVQCALAPPDAETRYDEARLIELEAVHRELYAWLEFRRTGAPAIEWYRNNRANYPFMKRWELD